EGGDDVLTLGRAVNPASAVRETRRRVATRLERSDTDHLVKCRGVMPDRRLLVPSRRDHLREGRHERAKNDAESPAWRPSDDLAGGDRCIRQRRERKTDVD